jgi:hypothetical protein
LQHHRDRHDSSHGREVDGGSRSRCRSDGRGFPLGLASLLTTFPSLGELAIPFALNLNILAL